MAKEIERKFLIPEEYHNYVRELFSLGAPEPIEQIYVSMSPEVRLRKQGNRYYETIKNKLLDTGLERDEFETEISAVQYDELKGAEICRVEKTRLSTRLIQEKQINDVCHLSSVFIEADIYHGPLDGLMTVEVPFDTKRKAAEFDPPEWFGDDVTELPEYKNAMLARVGLPLEIKEEI